MQKISHGAVIARGGGGGAEPPPHFIAVGGWLVGGRRRNGKGYCGNASVTAVITAGMGTNQVNRAVIPRQWVSESQ